MGQFERRAADAQSPDALYAIVGSLARAVDGVRAEVSDNTRSVDQLCRMVREGFKQLGVELDD
jgi:hypothetical protein